MKIQISYSVLLSLIFVIGVVTCYPNGAPAQACVDMIPQHGAPPQPGLAPYVTTYRLSSFNGHPNNEWLPITLSMTNNATGVPFKGFMVMAFDRNNMNRGAIGTFQSIGASSGKTLDCPGGVQNALTHVNNAPKPYVTAQWRPPAGFNGEAIFRTTYVLSGRTFWVGMESASVRITGPTSAGDKPATVWAGLTLILATMTLLV